MQVVAAKAAAIAVMGPTMYNILAAVLTYPLG
jgi:hypothetical protein